MFFQAPQHRTAAVICFRVRLPNLRALFLMPCAKSFLQSIIALERRFSSFIFWTPALSTLFLPERIMLICPRLRNSLSLVAFEFLETRYSLSGKRALIRSSHSTICFMSQRAPWEFFTSSNDRIDGQTRGPSPVCISSEGATKRGVSNKNNRSRESNNMSSKSPQKVTELVLNYCEIGN